MSKAASLYGATQLQKGEQDASFISSSAWKPFTRIRTLAAAEVTSVVPRMRSTWEIAVSKTGLTEEDGNKGKPSSCEDIDDIVKI